MKLALALACALAMGLAACAAVENDPLSWEEFEATATREPGGAWVLNGDELAETPDDLAAAYDAYRADVTGVGSATEELAVNRVHGNDDRWSREAAQNLSYCVSKKDFGASYPAVVAAMESAAGAWSAVARVRYLHVAAEDGRCNLANPRVVFDVRRVCKGDYLARSFWPSSSRAVREILIDCASFRDIAPYTLAGVLRHELGHTLGFRHEHTRPEAGTCFEDWSWRALTPYDSASVMHYPQCHGTNHGDLVLTALDVQGARALYP